MEDGGRPPFWKSLNRHISVKNRPMSMKLGTAHQMSNPMTVTWSKIEFFKIQDGGGRHLENRFFGYYSSNDCPISAKFCTRKQNGMLTRATGQNMQIFKIQDGGRPIFWKLLNRHISVKNCPISMKSTINYSKCWTRLQSRDQELKFLKFKMAATAILKIAFLAITHRPIVRFRRNFVWGSRTACRQRPHDENCKFLKSKMAEGHHFENRYIAIISLKNLPILMKFGTQYQILNPITVTWPKIAIFKIWDGDGRHLENRFFDHNSLTDCPISDKFCTRKQNGMPTKAAWKKLQIFKIQGGGRPLFWKSLNHHISVKLLLDFDKIWCTTAYTEPDDVFKSGIAVS